MAIIAEVQIYSPSPVLATSPNEWTFLEWDEKLQTNNQTRVNHSLL